MKSKLIVGFYILFLFVIGGCSFQLDTKSKNVHPYRIYMTPAFNSLWKANHQKYHQCTEKYLPNESLLYEVAYLNYFDEVSADLWFSLDKPLPNGYKIYQIGTSKIIFIVHSSNPIQSISIEKLREVYSGKITTWQALANNPKDQVQQGNINLYLYPPFDETTMAMIRYIQFNNPITGEARIIAYQKDMVETISKDPNGIGVVLEQRILQDSIKDIEIMGDKIDRSIPLLVNLSPKSEAVFFQWIGCLQQVSTP